MKLPEFLFKLTRPKDLVQQQCQWITRFATFSSASDFAVGLYDNSADEVFIITNVSVVAQADEQDARISLISLKDINPDRAAYDMRFGVYSPFTTGVQTIDPNFNVPPYQGLKTAYDWNGEYWLMPEHSLSVLLNFNKKAGAAPEVSCTLFAWCAGFLIPRGNATEA